MDNEWKLAFISGSKWSYKKSLKTPNTFKIFDPSGKDVAWLQIYSPTRHLFVVTDRLTENCEGLKFKANLPPKYVSGLLSAKDLILKIYKAS